MPWRSIGFLSVGGFALLFVLADVLAFPFNPALSDALRLVATGLIAAVAARQAFVASEARRWDGRRASKAWQLIGIGAVFSLIGLGVDAVSKFGFGTSTSPLWLMSSHLASGSLTAYGLMMLIASWPLGKRARLFLDSTITICSLTVLSGYFIITPVWTDTSGNMVQGVLACISPVVDTVLVCVPCVLIICAAGLRKLTASVALISAAGILIGIGGISSHLSHPVTILNVQNLDLLLAPAGWLLAAIAGTLNHRPKLPASSNLKFGLPVGYDTPLTAAGPYAIALVAFGLIAARELHQRGAVSGPIFILCATLMTLAFVRQLLTLRENQVLVSQIGVFNRDLESMVDRRTTQLQSLHSFSKAISTSLDFESVVRAGVSQICDAMRADGIIVNLTPLSLMTHASFGPHLRSHGIEPYPWVLEQLDILDVTSPARCGTLHAPDFTEHRKYALSPVVSKGRTFGWVAVLRDGQAYDHEDRAVLEGLTLELAGALENTRLYELARQMADLDPVTGLPNHRAAQQRFEFLFNHAQESGDSLGVLMIDVDNFKHLNDAFGHVVGDQVLKTIARVLRDAVGPHDVPARYGGDEFIILVPHATDDRLTEIARRIDERLRSEGYRDSETGRTIPFAVSVGAACYPDDASSRLDLVAAADRNMYHAKRSAKSGTPAPRTRGMRNDTIIEGFDLLDSMITAIDNKDYYTRAHSEEVTEYALWIAQELGCSAETQRWIRLAGMLHDVGKIGIPDEILRKPDSLSDDEFVVMRQHPEVGAFMVSNIPGLSDIVPGIRHHHERWDGMGYPDQLSGQQIPPLARLLAVPDVFSALTTVRPYRKGMEWDAALALIVADSGKAFDPEIVQAFGRALMRRRQDKSRAA